MKATGEVMAIGSNLESGLLKAIRSLEENIETLELEMLKDIPTDKLVEKLHIVDSERIFRIAEALRRGVKLEEICEITKIDKFFVGMIYKIVKMEQELAKKEITPELVLKAKKMGFTDKAIAKYNGTTEKKIRRIRRDNEIFANFKMVDTCSAEFAAQTPYYYSSYNDDNEALESDRKKILVLGSGPIRIGQGIEFDYCSVHGIWAMKNLGYETIIINNNPETVSTDFDIADKLYFEPLTREDVENIIHIEKPYGAIVQFGGQTAIKLTKDLKELGVKILGTSEENILVDKVWQ